MAALGYSGAAMVEFKVDHDRAYLMEINARLWGSLALTMAAGINIPFFWYEMLHTGRRDFPQNYRVGIYCRHWSGERNWLPQNLAAWRSAAPGLIKVPRVQIARELANIPFGREVSDTLSFDDPTPALQEFADIAKQLIGSRFNRTWIGRTIHKRRMRQRIIDARSLLFVCYGNRPSIISIVKARDEIVAYLFCLKLSHDK
jgi:hypothetical protein